MDVDKNNLGLGAVSDDELLYVTGGNSWYKLPYGRCDRGNVTNPISQTVGATDASCRFFVDKYKDRISGVCADCIYYSANWQESKN